MWSSDKLAACEVWARREYAWLYPLADANGCFEINLRVVWGKTAAIRPDLTQQRLSQVLDDFIRHGLLFTWTNNGKTYGHWTRSEMRLPPKSERRRHKSLAPDIPVGELLKYLKSFDIKEVSNSDDPGLDLGLVRVMVKGKDIAHAQKPGSRALDAFEIFYQAYPRKVGKPHAQKAWLSKVSDDSLLPQVLAAVDLWKKTEGWQDPQYIPHPATFLNQERWKDDIPKGGGIADQNSEVADRIAKKHGLERPDTLLHGVQH